MVAARDPAGDLHVDDAVVHAVPPDAFAHHEPQGRWCHRPGDLQLTERAPQAIEVAPLVDHPAAPDLAQLVNAVGELVAAILDMDHGVAPRQIATVDIGNARHRELRSVSAEQANTSFCAVEAGTFRLVVQMLPLL